MKQILLNAFAILGIAFLSVAQDGIAIKIVGDNTDYSDSHQLDFVFPFHTKETVTF